MTIEEKSRGEESCEKTRRKLLKIIGNIGIDTPLFKEISEKLSGRVAGERKSKGFLPKEIWLNTLETAGSYLCFEVPIFNEKGEVILKRRRTSNPSKGEELWENRLHIPGRVVSPTISGDEIVPSLIRDEIVKKGNEDIVIELTERVTFLGFVRYPEPERKTTADTILLGIVIPNKYLRLLQDDFEVLNESNKNDVIDQHLPTVEWLGRGVGKKRFFDTR
jgi:hypothetical protein